MGQQLKRVRLRLTTMGAVVGGALAFLWTDLLQELFWVALGAGIGWLVAYGLSILSDRWLGEAQVYERAVANDELTRDQLYERAQDLEIDGRSAMDKGELAEAVARRS